MIHEMLDDAFRSFEHLIELLQDAGVDTDILILVEDAREMLEDRHADDDDSS